MSHSHEPSSSLNNGNGNEENSEFSSSSSQLPSNVYAPAATFIMVPPNHRFYYSSMYPPNPPYFHHYPHSLSQQSPYPPPDQFQQLPPYSNPYSPPNPFQSQFHHPAMVPSTTPPPLPLTPAAAPTAPSSSSHIRDVPVITPRESLTAPSSDNQQSSYEKAVSDNEEFEKSEEVMIVSRDEEEPDKEGGDDEQHAPLDPYTSSSHHQSSLKATSHRCTQLTLQQKIEVLELIEKKIPYREIAKKFNIAHSTISGIKKTKEEIYQLVQKRANLSMHRIHKSMPITSKILDERMYNWYLHSRQQNVPINGRQIQQKALEIAKDLNLTNFKASNGWLDSFKRRHQILLKHQAEI